MKLVSVYRSPEKATAILYELLAERGPEESISHQQMPTPEEHRAFVESKPYHAWWLIEDDAGATVGAIYLSRQREIGVAILRAHRRRGFARAAIQEVMRAWPGRFLANINPANEKSIAMFAGLGFETCQITMRANNGR